MNSFDRADEENRRRAKEKKDRDRIKSEVGVLGGIEQELVERDQLLDKTMNKSQMDEIGVYVKRHLRWGGQEGADKVRFLALALCGETGELANLIKKDWRGDPGDRSEKIKEELADVANYSFMLAEVLGINLHDAMAEKFRAVEQRATFPKAPI